MRILALLLLQIAFVAPLFGQQPSTIDDPEWHIQRIIPVPDQSSEMVQAAIKAGGQPDLQSAKNFVVENDAAWEAIIQSVNEGQVPLIDSMAKKWEISVKEERIAGVTVRYVSPPELSTKNTDRVFIHLHGGGYVVYGGYSGILEAVHIAHHTKLPVVSIDYRMPPAHPFPAALDDVVTVYGTLIKKYHPKAIAVGGTSAGGGLSLAFIHKLKALELPIPAALFVGSPWSDLTKTGDTYFTNEGIDHILPTYEGMLKAMALIYTGSSNMKSPFISPVYGDFSEFPPTYLVTGTRDLLLSLTARTHRKLKISNVITELNIYEGISHAEYMFLPGSPENVQVYSELGTFLDKHLE